VTSEKDPATNRIIQPGFRRLMIAEKSREEARIVERFDETVVVKLFRFGPARSFVSRHLQGFFHDFFSRKAA
jgi:hypothetical protein